MWGKKQTGEESGTLLGKSVPGFHPGANCRRGREGGDRGTVGAFLCFHNLLWLLRADICVFLLFEGRYFVMLHL